MVSAVLFCGWTYKVSLPTDPGILIPRYWMLFVMDRNSVPSIAKIMMIGVNDKKTIEPLEDSFGMTEEQNCEHESPMSYWQSWKPTLILQTLGRT